MNVTTRLGLAALLSFAALAAVPAGAFAAVSGTVTKVGTVVTYTDATAAAEHLTVSVIGVGGTDILFNDDDGGPGGLNLTAGTGCVLVADGVNGDDVTCPVALVTSIVISTGDGSDVITIDNTIPATAAVTVNGGNGNDTIYGGDDGETLNGEAGSDNISGYAGNDTINTGDTTLSVETADGGPGNDIVNGGAGRQFVDGGAGTDTLNGGADDDYLNGGAGNDTVNGDAGDDQLDGGADNDTVNGG
ncbi:MAG: hypothetical protein H7123_01405, partial [Thermoleophilia bacterium]|nr:hypothetical protein [Thermoleophilia bacterium]